MDYSIQQLGIEHLPLVDVFSCIESDEELPQFASKQRRRIKLHSEEIDAFIKTEALEEQDLGLNTTFLFIDEANDSLAAFVSLCNDSIVLDPEERKDAGFPYTTVPAMKIARLAVANNYKHQGLGKMLVQFSAFVGVHIKNYSGVSYLTLDCYEHRASFYEELGFVRNVIQPIELPYDSPTSMRVLLSDFLERQL